MVAAVTEAIHASHHEPMSADAHSMGNHPGIHGVAGKRHRMDPRRIAERVEQSGRKSHESLLVALAAHASLAAPLTDLDRDWIASAAVRIGDENLLLETAGVVFAFNTINRIADARRVQLEYRFLRELKPIRGWVERRMASLIGLAYDLSYKHQPRHSPAQLLNRLALLFESLGTPHVPDVFHWLSRSPVVLEGVVEMLEANILSAGIHFDFLKEAAAIAVASRAIPGSGLRRSVDQWLSQASLPDANSLCSGVTGSRAAADSDLVSACRRYSWQVANAAYTITDEQIDKLTALGLSDAELLDLTLTAALFSALAMVESISTAVTPSQAGSDDAQPYSVAPQAVASTAASEAIIVEQLDFMGGATATT
ncbi:MAG TPA: hypothetical protein VFI31_00060 [Pirellulales bacterium]|nr:hypothetical protein [Pirellulales bacterium]